jgi:protein-S-isoprenylcysteine O-methyltransferase Ste14
MLFLRSILAAALLPGTVTVLVPWLILRRALPPAVHWSGLVPAALGSAILVGCIREFTVAGRGTLAPIDPPTRFVVSGLYRYVRNPMYVGVVLMLSGESLAFASPALAIYAAVFFALANLFIRFHEEPALRRKFGASYDDYRGRVPCWIPRLRG